MIMDLQMFPELVHLYTFLSLEYSILCKLRDDLVTTLDDMVGNLKNCIFGGMLFFCYIGHLLVSM